MFEFILKGLSPQMLLMLLPMLMLKIGTWLKDKDQNETGTDDAAGNIIIAAAPAVAAYAEGNEKSFRKFLTAVHTTIGNYLGFNSPPINGNPKSFADADKVPTL